MKNNMKKIGTFLLNLWNSDLFLAGMIFNSLVFRGSVALRCLDKGNMTGFWVFLVIEILAVIFIIKTMKQYFWPVDKKDEEELDGVKIYMKYINSKNLSKEIEEKKKG